MKAKTANKSAPATAGVSLRSIDRSRPAEPGLYRSALLAVQTRRRMKTASSLLAAIVIAAPMAWAQGQFVFSNRIGAEVNARFVLATDPPGTSSVGPGFRVELFGGPAGTPIEQLQPLRPPTTLFRTDRPPLSYGYVIASHPVYRTRTLALSARYWCESWTEPRGRQQAIALSGSIRVSCLEEILASRRTCRWGRNRLFSTRFQNRRYRYWPSSVLLC